MTHKFTTAIIWHDDATNTDRCVMATVTYTRHEGFPGNYVEPGEPDSVEIQSIVAVDGTPVPDSFLTDPELIEECTKHWIDDEIVAAGARADARRDDLMMEEF